MFWQLLIILKLIGIYDMPFESGRTLIILEVRGHLWSLFFGVRFLDINTPKTSFSASPVQRVRKSIKKIKKLEIAKKKLGRGDFGGSVGAQQTDKILRMAWEFEDEFIMEGENVTWYRLGIWYTCTALRYKPAFIATW